MPKTKPTTIAEYMDSAAKEAAGGATQQRPAFCKGNGDPVKAIVYYHYGSPDVLQLQEIDRPLGRDDGVLVKTRAAAVNPYDWHFMRGEPYFMRLGADEVIDYTKEEFTESGRRYDLILQLGGMHSPSHCRSALTPRGRLILSSGDSDGRWLGPLDRIITAAALSPFVSQTLRALDVKRSGEDLRFLANLVDAGKLKPVIDRTLSLRDVPEAIRYVEERHSRGKVVIAL